VLFDFIRMR